MWQCIAPVLREHNTTWASSATNGCKLATYSSFKRSCSRAASLALECKIGDSSYASWKNNVQVQQLGTISSSMWYGLACFSDRTMYSKDAVCTIGPGGHTEWPITAHCPLCRHCCLHDGSANWSLLRVSTSAGARVLTALTVYTAMVMRWPSQAHVSCHWCGLKAMPDMVRLCLRP